MKSYTAVIIGMVLLLLVGCAQQYYLKSNLNQISLGQSKEKTLAMFPSRNGIPGMEIRAAKRDSSGKLLEVGEVLLTDGVTYTVSHWFMFENGLLVQWGRPEDWKKAAIRYDINFNPSPGVSQN